MAKSEHISPLYVLQDEYMDALQKLHTTVTRAYKVL